MFGGVSVHWSFRPEGLELTALVLGLGHEGLVMLNWSLISVQLQVQPRLVGIKICFSAVGLSFVGGLNFCASGKSSKKLPPSLKM